MKQKEGGCHQHVAFPTDASDLKPWTADLGVTLTWTHEDVLRPSKNTLWPLICGWCSCWVTWTHTEAGFQPEPPWLAACLWLSYGAAKRATAWAFDVQIWLTIASSYILVFTSSSFWEKGSGQEENCLRWVWLAITCQFSFVQSLSSGTYKSELTLCS